MKIKTILLLAALCLSPSVNALTLQQYGVSFTGNGLIDHVSGLRWLDSGLTQGGLDELQFWLDNGWRIASEEELFFLVSRQNSEYGGSADVPLSFDDFASMMARLSISAGSPGSFSGPWVCRAFGDPQSNCNSVDSLGGQFVLEVESSLDQLFLSMYVYISEVPIYGSLDCFDFPDECNYMGRSLLVRAVPLPGAMILMFSALSLFTALRPGR